MAFRMRDKEAASTTPPGVRSSRCARGSRRAPASSIPVEMAVNDLVLKPLMDDQELDSRASTGTIYWEGAVTAYKKQPAVGAATWSSPATGSR